MRKLRRVGRVLLGWFIVAAFVALILAAAGNACLGRWSEAAELAGIALLAKLGPFVHSAGNTRRRP